MESNSDGFMLDSPMGTVVAAALVGDRKSEHVINWMLANFSPENNIVFKLLHVRPQTKLVPTPMGNLIPISQVRDDVAAAYRKEMEWLASDKITPCKKIFLRKKVPVNVVLIESDDAPSAIAEEVKTSFISKLVIEASSTSLFSRKLNLSSRISECIPSSCTVYAISNGKLRSLRPSDSDRIGSSMNEIDSSGNSFSPTYSTSMNSTILTAVSSAASFQRPSHSLPPQNLQDLALVGESCIFHEGSLSNGVRDQYLDTEEMEDVGIYCPVNSEIGSQINSSFTFTLDTATSDSHEASSSKSQEFLDLEKLKTELRHVQGIFAIAQTDTIEASRKIDELNRLRLGKAAKLKELKKREERALQIAREEKERSEAANRAAEATMGLAEQEAAVRKYLEERAISDAEETSKLENAVTGKVQNYQTFTWEELSTATSSFSKEHEIGFGANGAVYKCTLRHTTAAVKVLQSNNVRGIHQFRKELEILSRIHHPHLLMLLGACPERTCLVYEYMKNGNLEDRLKCKSNSPPIHWADRFRLAWEVASALVFLHSTKPAPIIHCDLKPANILLDSNLVSKIGDFGLSTILNPEIGLSAIATSDMGLIGTLCFIDPEYQRTGIISPMSDVYAFGMVILQLLTGRQAMALAHIVEAAIMDEKLTDILDSRAGCWPVEQTKELALVGLKCVEIRRKDRPDLKEEVLPKLLKLKQAAETQAKQCTHTLSAQPPPHFICPILKGVMEEPHVAADGYTYDHKAIKKRLERTDQSPITGQPLPHKHLVPNYTLLSAILRWQSSRS